MNPPRNWRRSIQAVCLLLVFVTPGSASAQGPVWWFGGPTRQRLTVPGGPIVLQSADLGPSFNRLDQINGSDVNQRDRSGSSSRGTSKAKTDIRETSKDCDKSSFRTNMSIIDKTLRRLEKVHKLESPSKDDETTEVTEEDRVFASREWKKLFEAEVAKAGLKTLVKGDRRVLRDALKSAFLPEVIASRGLNRDEVVKKLAGLTDVVARALSNEAVGKWLELAKGVVGLLKEPSAQSSGADSGVSSEEVLSTFAKTLEESLVDPATEKPLKGEGAVKEHPAGKADAAGEAKAAPKAIDWSTVVNSLKGGKLDQAAATTAADQISALAKSELPKGLSLLEITKVRLLGQKEPSESEQWAAAKQEVWKAIEAAKIGMDSADSIQLSKDLGSLAEQLRMIKDDSDY